MTAPDLNTIALTAVAAAAGPAVPGLLTPDDPDWTAFRADDPQYYLRAAGETIRKFCGWHIYPNLQTTRTDLKTGSRGIIMLPTRRVTQVDSLAIDQGNGPQPVDPSNFTAHQAGYLQLKGYTFYNDWYLSGYYYGNDPYYLPVTQPGLVSVTFWHGFDELPGVVKEVAFELAEASMAVRAGNVKMLESPGGYRLQTTQEFGMTLNCGQCDRLVTYRIGMVG